ncbi:MAG: hypothetical protein AAF321_12405 [Pseudomonadota bacterium]
MSTQYAPLGLIGVLTPQANTTVEPEMAILTPPGRAVLNARLTSDKGSIPERLRDYFDGYGTAARQFANAPVKAIGFACTGASYLAGVGREDAALAKMTARHGIPVITAATAVVDALTVLGARRILLASPYDAELDAASEDYWTARGFEVAGRTSSYAETDAFHPIYAMEANAAQAGIDRLAHVEADAIVMLGTGMPTLPPIAATPVVAGKPLLSCMSCLGWRLFAETGAWSPDAAGFQAFLHDAGWRNRLARSRPS